MVNEIIKRIEKKIVGRVTNKDNNYLYLAEITELAGDGDHLEIGTLFGGSAILAALLKREYGYSGKVVCIDPLDGYYRGVADVSKEIDPNAGIGVTLDVVMQNLKTFDLLDAVEIVQEKSYPFPLDGRRFVSAYIDGNHWQDWPTKDWHSVKGITDKYVLFDDYTVDNPSVKSACDEAGKDKDWKILFQKQASFALERIR